MASNPHKRDMKVNLIDLLGDPIMQPMNDPDLFQKVLKELEPDHRQAVLDALVKINQKPLTMFEVVYQALRHHNANPDKMSGQPKPMEQSERDKRFALMMRLRQGTMRLSDDDRNVIKESVQKYWSDNLIMGQACELLEGREFKPAEGDEE